MCMAVDIYTLNCKFAITTGPATGTFENEHGCALK